MISYKFEMYFNDQWNDISAYVETNAFLGDRVDQTFNLSTFVIPHIKSDKIVGIDLSKPIKPWTPVKITIDKDTFRFFTSDTSINMVKKADPKLYKHEINVVEATKVTQRYPVADSTVSQPKSSQFLSIYEANKKSDSLTIRNTEVTPTLNLINQSTDTTKVDGNVLKAGNAGQVNVTFEIRNYQYNLPFNLLNKFSQTYIIDNAEVELRAEVYSNGTKIADEDYFIPATGADFGGKWWHLNRPIVVDTPQPQVLAMLIDLPEDAVDQEITVKLKTLGNWDWWSFTPPFPPHEHYEDKVDVITYISVGAETGQSEEYIYLSDYIQSIVDSMNIKDDNDSTEYYVIDPTIISGTSNILCPEFTSEKSTAWDKLEKAANFVNAIPEIKEDFKTITFRYLDEISDIYYDQSMFDDETISYEMDTYLSALETNTSNLVEEDVLLNAKVFPYEGGWATTRTSEESVGQLTDDNAIFPTRGKIQKIYQLAVKGPSITIEHSSLPTKTIYGNLSAEELTKWGIASNESSASFWNIGDRVVDKLEWDILDNSTHNENDSARRTYRTRGNHIYYTQGSSDIAGLGYKTETLTDIIGSTVAPRALLETIMAACANYIDDVPAYVDYDITPATNSKPELAVVDNHKLYSGIKYRVYYVGLNDSRSRVYKHNAYELGTPVVDFINEQDKLNDTDNLGKFINTTLNRQGDLEYTVSGHSKTYSTIPKLGYRTYGDLVVTSRDLNLNKNLISYTLNLSKDFINRSTYLSRSSAFRSFEISNNDVVPRQDVYNEFMVLTKNKINVVSTDYSILTNYAKQMFIQNFCVLGGANENPISYAKVDVYKNADSSSEIYDMTVNPYSISSTINLQLGFETNMSAGSQLRDVTINSIPSKLEEFKQYTNQFGKVNKISATLYPRGKVDNTEADANLWPVYLNPTTDNALMTFERTIKKDAREKYSLNIQFALIPEDSSTIRVYPGIAKYNALIREKGNIDVGVALLSNGYKPTVNTTKVNYNRIIETTSTASSHYDSTDDVYGISHDSLQIPSGDRYEGYVVYEKNTNEMIYAVIEDISYSDVDYSYDTDTIWFVPRKYLKDNTRPTE